jgi:mono/diheme cytochrome c family protein
MKKRVLLAIASLVAVPHMHALGQASGDLAAGQALAMRVCAQCHKVAANQPAPARNPAPDFAAIATMSSTTEMSLHAFLSNPHPTMPNLILSGADQDNIITYILSLRARP